MSIRVRYQQFLQRRIDRPTGQISNWPAVVFSPHQDDETLGCGGTIFQKRQAGASVNVVFLTDGGISHRRFLAREAMSAIRKNEALAACSILGVEAEQVSFLGFPNGNLRNHFPEAGLRAAGCIATAARAAAQSRPASAVEGLEIYLPCAQDYHDEHRYTYQIIIRALRALQRAGQLPLAVQVLEYPIWYWEHWPWVPVPSQPFEKRRQLLMRMLATAFGLQSMRMFDHRVSIASSLERKRAALFAHASQTTRLIDDPRWATLFDIADGAFVERFLQPLELFRKGPCFHPRPR